MKFKTLFPTLFLALSVIFFVTSCGEPGTDPDSNEETNEDPYEEVESPDGEVYLYGNCYNSTSPSESALGLSGSYTWGVASKLTGSSLQKVGANILGVRLYVDAAVTNASVFVATQLGTPLYTQSFTYKEGGWQYVLFDEPFAVTGEDIYIGYNITGSDYILGFEYASRSTFSEYIYYNGSWSGTTSTVGADMYWSLQAIVNNRDYSSETQNDIVVEAVNVASYSLAGDDLSVTCEVRNNGIKVAKDITVSCEFGGTTVSATVPDSLMNGQSALVTFSGVVSPNTAGSNTLNISATSSAASDAVSAENFVYLEDLERNAIIVEQFTTANCGYCPAGTSYMSDAITGLEDPSKVVWVAHHAGYGTDGLTLTESSTICTALGVTGAPSCAINRTDVGYGLTWHPAYATTTLLSSLVAEPAAATMNLTTDYNVETRELTVTVSGRSTVITSTNYVTALIKQSGLIMSQTDYYTTGYTDATYSHNNAPRVFLSAAKGDELTLDGEGNYLVTFTCTIPDAVGDFDCIADDMDVAVYIHGDISTEPGCLVYNADQVSVVDATEPASIRRLYDTFNFSTSKFLIKSTNSNVNVCR